jgi:hypothetical protein
MSEAEKKGMRFSRILLAISLAAALVMIGAYLVVQRAAPVVEVPATFSH